MLSYSVDKKIKVRVRLAIIKNEKLLTHYNSEKDFYYYIGGKLDFGETLKEGWEREIKEELGESTKFIFNKVLYIRDYIDKEIDEHSVEIFILGDINKLDEVEGLKDPQHGGKTWFTWLDINNLPDNLYPKPLSKKILEDYKNAFPNQGEYIGRMDSD